MVSINNKIALIIPCYNEASRLQFNQFEEFISSNKDTIDFYFMDDGSTDNTYNLLKSAFDKFSNVSINTNILNLGKAEIIRNAILKLETHDYKYYGFIDADLQIPLEQVFELEKYLDDKSFKLAITVRKFSLYDTVKNPRNVLSVLFRYMASFILKSKPRIRDTQCGCKIFSREIVSIAFDQPFISSWLFDLEILLRLRNVYGDLNIITAQVEILYLKESKDSKVRWMGNMALLNEIYSIHKTYN
jgi:glycosyltransferase involved in cell wall biosynthesis